MDTKAELDLLTADVRRPDRRHDRPWMRVRIRQLKADLRQEHKAFLRVLKLWPSDHLPETRKVMVRYGTPMSPDTWIGPKRRRMEQNCEQELPH